MKEENRNRKGGGGGVCVLHLYVRPCSSFWIVKLFESSPQELFDHPKGDYVHDSREDVFLSYKESAGKLLADQLLRDDI